MSIIIVKLTNIIKSGDHKKAIKELKVESLDEFKKLKEFESLKKSSKIKNYFKFKNSDKYKNYLQLDGSEEIESFVELENKVNLFKRYINFIRLFLPVILMILLSVPTYAQNLVDVEISGNYVKSSLQDVGPRLVLLQLIAFG